MSIFDKVNNIDIEISTYGICQFSRNGSCLKKMHISYFLTDVGWLLEWNPVVSSSTGYANTYSDLVI